MSAAPCTTCGGTRVCTPAGSGLPRPCPVCRPESYGPARSRRPLHDAIADALRDWHPTQAVSVVTVRR